MNIKDFYKQRYKDREYSQSVNVGKKGYLYDVYQEISKEDLKGRKIMDVGAGNGLLLRKLRQEYGIFPTANDLSEDNIAFLKKEGIECVDEDMANEGSNFQDDTFDHIICTEVIEHVFDCSFLLEEMYRILKKGGKLYLTTHNSFNIAMRLKYLQGRIPARPLDVSGSNKGEHIRIFNRKTLEKICREAGFYEVQNKSRLGFKNFSVRAEVLTGLFSKNLFF
jgi:2-polyprenyl-3-methyl-5-hydroxy-6-metoxy-1,4-benzoquinol methylase